MKLWSMANYGEKGQARIDPESMKNLEVAKQMRDAGEPEQKIKEATGWEYLEYHGWRRYHIDGHFKYENIRKTIDRIYKKAVKESQAALQDFHDKGNRNDENDPYWNEFVKKHDAYRAIDPEHKIWQVMKGKLDYYDTDLMDVWEDESLYKAYPELLHMPVHFSFDTETSEGGEYDGEFLRYDDSFTGNGKFVINLGWRGLGKKNIAQTEIHTNRGTFIHEIQHAIQSIERGKVDTAYHEDFVPRGKERNVLAAASKVINHYKEKTGDVNRFDIIENQDGCDDEKLRAIMDLARISDFFYDYAHWFDTNDLRRIFTPSLKSVVGYDYAEYANSPWERESRAMDDMKDVPDADKHLSKEYETWLTKENYPYGKLHK